MTETSIEVWNPYLSTNRIPQESPYGTNVDIMKTPYLCQEINKDEQPMHTDLTPVIKFESSESKTE